MTDPKDQKPMHLGIFSRRGEGLTLSSTEVVAAVASIVWLFLVSVFFLLVRGDGSATEIDSLRFVITIIAIFMPVALIWVAATAAKSTRILKEESARLQAAINAMRQAYVQQQQSGVVGVKPALEQKLDELVAAQRRTDAAIARFISIPPSAEARDTKAALSNTPPTGQEQPSLALGTPAEALAPPLSVAEFIRALNFPEDADDKEGFRTLRRALQDRSISQLVQSAQDVLTFLSQEGIYMDDLQPDRARPEVWRRFAKGERGRTVAALGGIRDRSSLALAAARMRQDHIFRDSAHHFLRKFDHTFSEFEKNATDEEIAALADTRTARAFMLLGRVTGTFD